MKNYAIILASGNGSRYGKEIPKQFVKIADKTIFEHAVNAFENAKDIDSIVIVINSKYRTIAENILLENNYKKVIKLINGGETRKESSYNGISSIKEDEANVLIHDCARPFVNQKIISDCIEALKTYNAVVPVIQTSDTIYEIGQNNIINNIPNRNHLRRAQTPQCFKLSLIKKAHELSKDNENYTDDCGLVIKNNLTDIYVVEGSIENIKITYPNDITIAEMILKNRNFN